MAAVNAYQNDDSARRREAAQKNLTRYRKRAFKRAVAQWLFIAALVAIGYAAGTLTKSCSAAQAADTTTSNPSPMEPATPQSQAEEPAPEAAHWLSAEEWCADFIRAHAEKRGAKRAKETASAVVACAPLLGPWMDEREATCFIMAVIWKESTFDPEVTGTSNDRGLMQLVDRYHKWRYGGKDWRCPAVNVRAGTGLLAEKMKKYHGALDKVLTSYNGSRKYVAPVMKKYRTLLKSWDVAGVAASVKAQAEPHMDRL